MIDCDAIAACRDHALPPVLSVYDITGEKKRGVIHVFPPHIRTDRVELLLSLRHFRRHGYRGYHPILIITFL